MEWLPIAAATAATARATSTLSIAATRHFFDFVEEKITLRLIH